MKTFIAIVALALTLSVANAAPVQYDNLGLILLASQNVFLPADMKVTIEELKAAHPGETLEDIAWTDESAREIIQNHPDCAKVIQSIEKMSLDIAEGKITFEEGGEYRPNFEFADVMMAARVCQGEK